MAEFIVEKGDFFESSRKKEELEYLLGIFFNLKEIGEIERILPKGCYIVETPEAEEKGEWPVYELRNGALPQGYPTVIAVIKRSA